VRQHLSGQFAYPCVGRNHGATPVIAGGGRYVVTKPGQAEVAEMAAPGRADTLALILVDDGKGDLLGVASGATGNPAILVYSTRMAS
jgi:hypothetical protein